MGSASPTQHRYPPVKLPHPFLTAYRVQTVAITEPATLALTLVDQPADGRPPPQPLHSDSISWLELTSLPKNEWPAPSDNGPWARARRSPSTTFQWEGDSPPSLGQVWNVIHAIYLGHPTHEYFRLNLQGAGRDLVRSELLATGLGAQHPKQRHPQHKALLRAESFSDELLILRAAFWQGAASPAGPRPIWAVGDGTDGGLLRNPLAQYPLTPETFHITNKFPEQPVYARHPTRRPKPRPGSVVYSRYIPELDEHFSLEVVDWTSAEHLALFHKWQNDPRVAAGWDEAGDLEHHRRYLRDLHFDPHVLCLFGRFDNARFAYFELYWAKACKSFPPRFPFPFVIRSQVLYCGTCFHLPNLNSGADTHPPNRKTTTARTTTRTTTTGAGTRWWARRASAARGASARGTRAASTTASWTTPARPAS